LASEKEAAKRFHDCHELLRAGHRYGSALVMKPQSTAVLAGRKNGTAQSAGRANSACRSAGPKGAATRMATVQMCTLSRRSNTSLSSSVTWQQPRGLHWQTPLAPPTEATQHLRTSPRYQGLQRLQSHQSEALEASFSCQSPLLCGMVLPHTQRYRLHHIHQGTPLRQKRQGGRTLGDGEPACCFVDPEVAEQRKQLSSPPCPRAEAFFQTCRRVLQHQVVAEKAC